MHSAVVEDTGLRSLALITALSGQSLDLQQASQEYLRPGCISTRNDILRIARRRGFKTRATRSTMRRLDAVALPVIARHRDGSFFVIGRRTDTGVLVGISGGPPTAWSLDELATN